MSKNNPKTCPLKSNFAFAIIAILTVGLLLYTTIEVSNCKQGIAQINDRVQNSPKLVKVDNKDSEVNENSEVNKNDSNESDQDVVDDSVENINNSKEIVYNKDGSIDTSNWKIYKNEKLGFSVRYPKSWKVSFQEDDKNIVYLDKYIKEENDDIFANISIERFDSVLDIAENKSGNLNARTIEEFIEKNVQITFDQLLNLDKRKAFGIVWYGMGVSYAIISENNEKVYVIFINGNYEKYSKIKGVRKEILKSFKFL